MAKRLILAAAAAAALLGARAEANDSAATIGAGGLVLTRQADVAMEAETLTIRPGRVSVRYRFRNRGPRPVETVVAFVMPDIPPHYLEDGGFGPRADPENFVGFTIRVDGRPVRPRSELRALRDGRDLTAALRAAGVPVSLFDARLGARLQRLDRATLARLVQAGAVTHDPPSDPVPAWTLRARWYWTQRFAPGEAVTVEHSYQPIAGAYLVSRDQPWSDPPFHCADEPVRAAIGARLRGPDDYGLARQVDYVLTSANSWAGPIGTFSLVVEADEPGQVAAACFDGARRVSPQRLEATLAGFAPRAELTALFLNAGDPAPRDLHGRWPEASQRVLGDADLAPLSREELRLMRNEIFARHGYIFASEPLRRHFSAQPWYRAQHADVTARLSAVERRNVALIAARERGAR